MKLRIVLAALVGVVWVMMIVLMKPHDPSKQERNQQMLIMTPSEPRHMVFALRSYTGSRRHLLAAANALLDASPLGAGDPKNRGGHRLQLLEAKGELREHYFGALRYKTAISLQQALAIAAGVEKKLEDPHKPGARETVRIDLVWVQGVEIKTPELVLPSPELEKDGRLAWMLLDLVQPVAHEFMRDHAEWLKFYEHYKKRPLLQRSRYDEHFDLTEDLGLYRKPTYRVWDDLVADRATVFATAGRAVGTALIERIRTRKEGEAPLDARLAEEIERYVRVEGSPPLTDAAMMENSYSIERARDAQREQAAIPLTAVTPVEISFSSGTKDEQLAMRWASEVQATARDKRLRLAHVVVTSLDARGIGGLLLGEVSSAPIPGVELLGANVEYRPDKHPSQLYGISLRTGKLLDQE